jgi:hypothetical protein
MKNFGKKNSTADLQTSSYSHLERTSEKEQTCCTYCSPTVQINLHPIGQYSLNEVTDGRETRNFVGNQMLDVLSALSERNNLPYNTPLL